MPQKKKSWSDLSAKHDAQKAIEAASQKHAPATNQQPMIFSESEVPLAANKDDEFLLETLVTSELAGAGYNFTEVRQEAKEIAFILQGVDTEQISMVGLTSGDNVAAGTGSIRDLLLKAFPKKKKDRIKRCYKHFEDCDLLQDLIIIKHDFTMLGLSLLVAPPGGATIDTDERKKVDDFQLRLRKLQIKLDLAKVTSDLLKDYYLTGSCILYWQIDPRIDNKGNASDSSKPSDEYDSPFGIPGLVNICALNPGDVDWDNSLGQDILTIDIPDSVKARITTAFHRGFQQNKNKAAITQGLVESGIGLKWIVAVRAGKGFVELRKEDGDHWLIRTTGRKYHGLADPMMKSIFLTLEAYVMLTEGEFSAAFLMKHFVQLIQGGESITQGPLSGSTKNWIKPNEAQSLMKQIAGVNKAARMAVNHTVKISFIFPPKEMFDGERFQSIDNRIYRFAGVSRSLDSGEGQNYGGGFLSIKKLIASIRRTRDEISLLWLMFFADETIIDRIKTPEDYLVSTTFDENALKEPAQLLNEVKELFDRAMLDPRTSLQTLGYNPDAIVASTIRCQAEEEKMQVWSLVSNNIRNGNPDPNSEEGGKEGRPANPGTTTSEETRTQNPGGRTTENT